MNVLKKSNKITDAAVERYTVELDKLFVECDLDIKQAKLLARPTKKAKKDEAEA